MTSWTDEAANAHLFIPLARETVELLATEPDPLTCIEKITEMRGWVEDVLAEYVADARLSGHGWDAIATSLGVTRQAAWQRFHTVVEPAPRPDDFLRADEIWTILTRGMRRGRWHELTDLYALVESTARLTAADLEPDAPNSNAPRWQRNVRNVLQRRKTVGDLEWDGRARYRLS